MEAKLCFIGHALMENRSGLIVDTRLTRVSGHAERMAALDMKRIEEAFGWMKTIAGLCKTKLCGLPKVDWAFAFIAAAYNLVRVPKLIGATG